MTDDPKTYSIMLRLKRVTYEDAYVAVPVTGRIMTQKEDGTSGIDFDAFVTEAKQISKDARVEWVVESTQVEPHPIQGPKPEDRKCLDGYWESAS
jgi:hypothetical protein